MPLIEEKKAKFLLNLVRDPDVSRRIARGGDHSAMTMMTSSASAVGLSMSPVAVRLFFS
jgi:hypothetical protein